MPYTLIISRTMLDRCAEIGWKSPRPWPTLPQLSLLKDQLARLLLPQAQRVKNEAILVNVITTIVALVSKVNEALANGIQD